MFKHTLVSYDNPNNISYLYKICSGAKKVKILKYIFDKYCITFDLMVTTSVTTSVTNLNCLLACFNNNINVIKYIIDKFNITKEFILNNIIYLSLINNPKKLNYIIDKFNITKKFILHNIYYFLEIIIFKYIIHKFNINLI